MHRSNPLAATVLLVAGVAWLLYKAPYLGLDAPDDLKAFIIAPSVVLLVAATWVGFPDVRRRVGFSFLALGLVALVWAALAPPPDGGWTFYTPYSSTYGDRAAWLKGPDAALVAGATLLPAVGLAILHRRSLLGGALVGASLWSALCLQSSRGIDAMLGMPRRYSYYNLGGAKGSSIDFQAVLPILLALVGVALLLRTRKGPTGGESVRP